jgi:hypothetical protein
MISCGMVSNLMNTKRSLSYCLCASVPLDGLFGECFALLDLQPRAVRGQLDGTTAECRPDNVLVSPLLNVSLLPRGGPNFGRETNA